MYFDKKFTFLGGWCDKAYHHASPNYNERPKDTCINSIIIHHISLPPAIYAYDYVTDFFMNRLNHTEHPYFDDLKNCFVSAHFYIRRQGELHQYVSTDQRAWHAGESLLQGESNCNNFSIGIELEGTGFEPFDARQYPVLAELINSLQKVYPAITRDRIVGHSDVAPLRKTDPGPFFDWERLWQTMDE
jgi:N-acetyl-anhydromuramoyl-L-alanine amidase